MSLSTSEGSARPTVLIEPGQPGSRYLRDVWRLRHLIWIFSWREIVLRYRQTTAGVLWVVIRPLITMAIFAVVFGRFLKVPSGNLPYALVVLSGLIPWQFAAYSFSGAAESLFSQVDVISKVYFPRLIAPLSAVVVNAVDLIVSLLLIGIFMIIFGVVPDVRLLALPVFVIAAMPAVIGLGLWFAAVSVKYRDFRNVIPFVVMLSLYISPVAYPTAVVPERYKFIFWMNPLVGVIEGFRWSLFRGEAELYWPGIACAFAISIVLLLFGYGYFRRVERTLVDVI